VVSHWPWQSRGASMGWQIGIKPVPAGAVKEHRLHFIHHVAVVQIATMKHQNWPSRTALLVVDINAVYMCQPSYTPGCFGLAVIADALATCDLASHRVSLLGQVAGSKALTPNCRCPCLRQRNIRRDPWLLHRLGRTPPRRESSCRSSATPQT